MKESTLITSKTESGIMMLEFALSIMVFLIVVFGVFDCIMFGLYHNRLQSIVSQIGYCSSFIRPEDSNGNTINRWNNGRASVDASSPCFMPDTPVNTQGTRALAYRIIGREYPEIANSSALRITECSLKSAGGATACCTAQYGHPDKTQAGCAGSKGGFKTITLTYQTGFFDTVVGLLGGGDHVTAIKATSISKNSAIDQHEND
jgi:hypothetical protein